MLWGVTNGAINKILILKLLKKLLTNHTEVDIIIKQSKIIYADVAHLVERHLAKVEVAGSSPVIRSLFMLNIMLGIFLNKEQSSNKLA